MPQPGSPREQDAHLDVLSLGPRPPSDRVFLYRCSGRAGSGCRWNGRAEDAAALDAAAKARACESRISAGRPRRVVAQMGGIAPLVATRARVSDLVVLPHPYGKGKPPEAEAVLEAALFDGGCPGAASAGRACSRPTRPTRRDRLERGARGDGGRPRCACRCSRPPIWWISWSSIPPDLQPGPVRPRRRCCARCWCATACKAEVSVLARTHAPHLRRAEAPPARPEMRTCW